MALTGKLFTTLNSSAAYVPPAPPVTPLTVPGTPAALYSLIRPSNYPSATSPFRAVSTTTTTEMDAGWDAVTGKADFAAIDTWAAGLGETWKLHTWYDLTGSGHHLTSPSAGTRPLNFGNTVKGTRCFTNSGPGLTHYTENTTLALANIRATTMGVIHAPHAGGFSGTWFALGYPTPRDTIAVTSGTGMNGFTQACGVTSPQVSIYKGNGTGSITFTQNGVASTKGAVSSSAVSGFRVGSSGSPSGDDYVTIAIYDSTLSAGDETSLRDGLYAASGITATNDNVALHGDSITQGSRPTTESNETTWARITEKSVTRNYTFYNLGWSGQSALNAVTTAGVYAPKCYSASSTRNTAFIFFGTNDLAANSTAATVMTRLQNTAAAWKTAGYNSIIIATCLPRKAGFTGGQTSGGFETERLALNALIRAAVGTDWDVVCDWGNTSELMGDEANCNATYYYDLIHPSTAGYALLAPYAIAAINGLG